MMGAHGSLMAVETQTTYQNPKPDHWGKLGQKKWGASGFMFYNSENRISCYFTLKFLIKCKMN